MKIIPRATLIFRPSDAGQDTVKLVPSSTPVEVPDWLRSDDLFKLCVKDGTIVVPADPSAAPSSEQLTKVSDRDLLAEVTRRGIQPIPLGGSPATPAPVDSKAAKAQQDKADAANKANAGRSGGPGPVEVMAANTGDERTSRNDAPASTEPLPASVDPKAAATQGTGKVDDKTPGAAKP